VNGQVDVREASFSERRSRNRFIDVPWRLYRDDPAWVPPLRMSVARLLKPTNPFYEHAEMTGFVATRDGKPVGRIAAIVNHRHNAFHNEKTGFFGFFESTPDAAVAHALFDRAASWLRQRGMDRMRGPMNPSTNDECGLLVDGFDDPPCIMMTHNPPYYADLIESYGFVKAKDLWAYRMFTANGMPERIRRLADRMNRRNPFTIRPIDMKHVTSELKHVRAVYNVAWERNWGFVPLTDAEFDFAADDLKELAEPDCALLAFDGEKPVGFCLAVLDANQVFAKIRNGRLLPFGLLTFLREKRRINRIRVITLGVIPEYRKRGIELQFYMRCFEAGERKRYVGGEMSWVLEDNFEMNEAMKAMGGEVYKVYRIYDYTLNASN
jgi:GNAT superfamily N-acetyltransferase